MSALEWVLLAGWAAGALATARMLGRALYADLRSPYSDGDLFEVSLVAAGAAFLGAGFWPLIAAGFLLHRSVSGNVDAFATTLFGESQSDKLARRERELQARERRIAQLEREMEIR